MCTWRYGAPGAVARADRSGGAFLPAEADACRLILRGEVDAVLAVGPLLPSVEAALAVMLPLLPTMNFCLFGRVTRAIGEELPKS